VQIRELTEKCFSLENERSKYAEETEKLNLICHQLYTELEEWKRKYAEIDLTLKDKYEIERNKNNELAQDIERWKARYMAAEKSKAQELEDLRQMMESQRKSVVDR
jgi:septum formation inhibitor MinC